MSRFKLMEKLDIDREHVASDGDNVIFCAHIDNRDRIITVRRELAEEELGDGPMTQRSFERWVDDCRAWLTHLAKRKIVSEEVVGEPVTVASIDRWR